MIASLSRIVFVALALGLFLIPFACGQDVPAQPDGDATPACEAGSDCCHCNAPQTNAEAESSPVELTTYSEWKDSSDRKSVAGLQSTYTDHDGRSGTMAELLDRPTAITFFYTRCQNPNKCSKSIATMAELQKALGTAGLTGKVRLLMISYEPQYDTPGRLKNYATSRSVCVDGDDRLLILNRKSLDQVMDSLEVPVNYNSGWVNIHGVALYLLDRNAGLARTHHTLIWSNEAVVEDLKRLVDEPTADQ